MGYEDLLKYKSCGACYFFESYFQIFDGDEGESRETGVCRNGLLWNHVVSIDNTCDEFRGNKLFERIK